MRKGARTQDGENTQRTDMMYGAKWMRRDASDAREDTSDVVRMSSLSVGADSSLGLQSTVSDCLAFHFGLGPPGDGAVSKHGVSSPFRYPATNLMRSSQSGIRGGNR